MNADDFRAIRELYGESQLVFGRRLGFDHEPNDTVRRKVRRYELGETPIVGTMAALLTVLRELKMPKRGRRISAATERKATP